MWCMLYHYVSKETNVSKETYMCACYITMCQKRQHVSKETYMCACYITMCQKRHMCQKRPTCVHAISHDHALR
jgi:hypothetical protein